MESKFYVMEHKAQELTSRKPFVRSGEESGRRKVVEGYLKNNLLVGKSITPDTKEEFVKRRPTLSQKKSNLRGRGFHSGES